MAIKYIESGKNKLVNSISDAVGIVDRKCFKKNNSLIVETLNLKGYGSLALYKMLNSFSKWGWTLKYDSYSNDAEFVLVNFRPTQALNNRINQIREAKRRGLFVLLYIMEPLDLRKETWSNSLAELSYVTETLELSDVIIVNSVGYKYVSEFEELKIFSKYLNKTVVIEECISETIHSGLPRKHHNPKSEVTSVWHGYSKNHERWVLGRFPEEFSGALDLKYYPSMLDYKNDFRYYGNLNDCLEIPLFTVMGSRNSENIISHPGDYRIGKLLQNFDVGIAPFNTGIYRTNAKPFGLKIQSYIAAGVPVIASPIPDYKRWLQHGVTALFADSKSEWREMSICYLDHELRQFIADNAKEMLFRNFSPMNIMAKF